MSGPTKSYLKVQYDFRPAKQVERRMMLDAFQILNANGPYDEPSFCYLQAWTFLRNRHFREAAQYFNRVIQIAPSTELFPVPDFIPGHPITKDFSEDLLVKLTCPKCGELARPHVLWFDDILYNEKTLHFNLKLSSVHIT